MEPLNRIIIDTDPGTVLYTQRLKFSNLGLGVDDILAIMLALAAKPEELEILLLSITYGNVEVQRWETLKETL